MVHDSIDEGLQLLDSAVSKVLVGIMWLTLPVTNAISLQDFLDWVADFNLCPITYELSGGPLFLILSSSVLMNCLLVLIESTSVISYSTPTKTWAMVAPKLTASVYE